MGDPATIAHRGFAGVYPENTLAAVEGASGRRAGPVDRPADAIEVDVMPCGTGEVVVVHDTTLDRLTDASGELAEENVWDVPFSTLRSLSVLGTGQVVPRLEEVLAAVPPSIRVDVEFKNPGRGDVRFAENLAPGERESRTTAWRPFAERVISILDDHPHEVLVSSFYEGAIAAVREVDPTVPTAWIFWDSVADGLAVARRYDCEAIHPPWNMVRGTPLFNAEYVTGPFADVDLLSVAGDEGWEVNAWTVTTWRQAHELVRAGVDGVLTDYPGVLDYDANGNPREGTG